MNIAIKDKSTILAAIALVVGVVMLLIAAAAPSFLIGNGKLTTPLNGNGQSFTNAGTIETTNLTVHGSAYGVVINLVTNGDNSISVVSNAGNFTLRATNITEL